MIRLRLVERRDMPAIADIYAPFVRDNAVSFELEVPSAELLWQRAEAILPVTPWLVAEQSEQVVGYAYASPHRDRAAYQWTREVSVYIRADCRGRGIAERLYRALFDILCRQGFTNLLAGITLPNPASIGFHERLGFRPVGIYHRIGFKFGRYHDVGWWERPLGLPDQIPGTWLPLALLRDKPELQTLIEAWNG